MKIDSPVSVERTVAKVERLMYLDTAPLSALLERAKAIATIDVRALEALAVKLLDRNFNLVVVGELKRGKSTLINALLGRNLLPTGVAPLTSAVTVLEFGSTCAVRLVFEDGHTETVSTDKLPDFVTEGGNPNNARGGREAHVMLPAQVGPRRSELDGVLAKIRELEGQTPDKPESTVSAGAPKIAASLRQPIPGSHP